MKVFQNDIITNSIGSMCVTTPGCELQAEEHIHRKGKKTDIASVGGDVEEVRINGQP